MSETLLNVFIPFNSHSSDCLYYPYLESGKLKLAEIKLRQMRELMKSQNLNKGLSDLQTHAIITCAFLKKCFSTSFLYQQ